MNYRKLLAALAAATLMTGAVSCGKDDTSEASESVPVSASADTDAADEASEEQQNDEAEDEEKSEKTTQSSKSGDKKDSKSDKSGSEDSENTTSAATTAQAGDKTSAATTTAKSRGSSSKSGSTGSGGSKSGSSSGNSSYGDSGSSAEGSSSENYENTDSGSAGSGNTGNTGNTGSSGNTGGAAAESPAEAPAEQQEEPAVEEPEYTAEVVFDGSPQVTGGSVTVDGNTVNITSGGDYIFYGSSSDGQICVSTETEEKVKIILAGVDLTCQNGPAIFINEAKKCTVEVQDGTYNYLCDSAKDKINDGVIFSNDTLRLKGSGYLEITAGNRHGIASDDDIIIDGSGTYVITSVKSGILAHDDITVNGGDITVKGGTNGLKSKGTININGGILKVSGGTKEEKSSIYAGGVFSYNGGYVYAAGNMVTAPTYTVNPYAVASLTTNGTAGGSLGIFINGYEQVTLSPHNDYRCVMVLSPELYSGCEFGIDVDGNYHSGYTVEDGQNVFTIE